MANPLGPKEIVTVQELAISNMLRINVLIELLERGHPIGDGVGPSEVNDIAGFAAKSGLQNPPIMAFSRAKRLLFPEAYGQSKTTFHTWVHLACPSEGPCIVFATCHSSDGIGVFLKFSELYESELLPIRRFWGAKKRI